jgi:hypothetical protein
MAAAQFRHVSPSISFTTLNSTYFLAILPAPCLLFLRTKVKVRIKATPREHELDGVRLDRLASGDVRDVSPSIGSWLIAEGYAEPEMRQGDRREDQEFTGVKIPRVVAHDRRRKNRSDR